MAELLFLRKYYEFDVKKREERENVSAFFRPMERNEKRRENAAISQNGKKKRRISCKNKKEAIR